MIVGTIILRADGLTATPGVREIGAGILVHQTFDFLWTVLFFVPLGRWTRDQTPARILLLALPWAVLTSSTEYFLWLPWAQPLFVMQQPYWPGLGAHVISASLYPLFPWLRDRLGGRPSPWRSFARGWIALAVVGAAVLSGATWLGARGHEPSQLFLLPGDPDMDREFLRMMIFHHEIGIDLAQRAAAQADEQQLRQLASLMIADQSGETDLMRRWWQSWFGSTMLPLSPDEQAAMPGMPTVAAMQDLASAKGRVFDVLFVEIMSRHHAGAITMATEAMDRAVDPRTRIMAQGIRHAQRNQIAIMHRLLSGLDLQSPLRPGQTPAAADVKVGTDARSGPA